MSGLFTQHEPPATESVVGGPVITCGTGKFHISTFPSLERLVKPRSHGHLRVWQSTNATRAGKYGSLVEYAIRRFG